MRISEASTQSGLSIDTIRYYERSGLLPPIDRGRDGRRKFTTENVDWLVLLASLRDTGMPMAKMRRFAELYRQGDRSIPERRQILLEHEDALNIRRVELDRCAELLAYKLRKYAEIEGATGCVSLS
jgi:DNA-binding transcriptional MerR regulator